MPEKFYVANKGVVIQKEKALLLEARDPKEGPYWDLPGGRMETDETVERALLRELQEELPSATNLAIGKHLHTYKRPRPYTDGTYVVFNIFAVTASLPTVTLSDEHTGYRWVTKEELLDLSNLTPERPISPEIQKAITVAFQSD